VSLLRLLHVEDEANARQMLADLLGGEADVTAVPSAEEGLAKLEEGVFDLTLLDWNLPGMDGGAFLRAVRDHGRAGRVVVLTAVGTFDRAVESLRAGAYDFLVKPADPDALLGLVDRVARSKALLETAGRSSAPAVEVSAREGEPAGAPASPGTEATSSILGRSPEVLDLKERLELVASSDASVLIVGESGTGKELVARALHEASGRHKHRMVTVNCAAIPEALFESELFGHKKGAFTGAAADRPGLVELAHEGTLFLDEVGELTPNNQAKLLRVLQEHKVRRVGESRDRDVSLRVIAATNRDLEVEADNGAFREDLLYRLDVVRLDVPPLRDRRGDLPQLLEHFLTRYAATYQRPAPELTPADLSFLHGLEWPGNVRELENTAKRLVLLGANTGLAEVRRRLRRSGAASPEPSSPTPAAATAPPENPSLKPEDVEPLRDVLQEATRQAVIRALKASGGQRTQAAALLGVSRKTLFNKMQELGIREESSWS
jgi:DNA-binding NtrC family response regulator